MKLHLNFLKKTAVKKNRKQERFVPATFLESKFHTYQKHGTTYRISVLIFQYTVAVALSALASYLKVHYESLLGTSSPFLLLFSAVLFSGWIGGLGPALVATICCAATVMYSFALQDVKLHAQAKNLIASTNTSIIIFILEGIIIGILLEKRRRSDRLLRERIRQQAVISQISQYALASPSIAYFYAKVSELVTTTLDLKYCKILELLPGKKAFLLIGGIGWKPGLVGHSHVTAGTHSQGGYTLLSEKPIIVRDLKKEKRFYNPELLMSHGVRSGMSVIIPGKKGPYGILGVHSEKVRRFTNDDISFIQAISNIMATAIEKKASEQELRESEIRFKRLFDSDIIGAFISDFKGRFLDANDALLSLIGYTREDLREGKVQRDILTAPEYAALSIKAVKDLRTKGASDVYEKVYITKLGERIPVLLAVSRIDDKTETCVGFVLNISKQKELEKRKDEFIGMASHELKTPITSLKVLTQFLQQKMITSQQTNAVTYLDKINKQVDKLTNLINDLLDVTQMQAGKLKLKKTLFNLDNLVNEIVMDIQAVTTTHTIVVQSTSTVTVFADASRIAQIITNLVTNAIKYAPDYSEIIATVKEKDGNAVVSVQDFGPGIDKQFHKSIFEQFFRINEKDNTTYPGLGMGLYISREIIERHNGKIWVESEKGHGSTFCFSLPLPEEKYEYLN